MVDKHRQFIGCKNGQRLSSDIDAWVGRTVCEAAAE